MDENLCNLKNERKSVHSDYFPIILKIEYALISNLYDKDNLVFFSAHERQILQLHINDNCLPVNIITLGNEIL